MDYKFLSLLLLGLFRSTVSRSVGTGTDSLEKETCLRAPESVLINCHVINASSWDCIESNVISIPVVESWKNIISINCTAPYPLNVRVSGFELEDTYKTLFVRNAENVFNEATFVYSIGIVVDNFTVPRKIFVSKQNDPINQMEFFMFRPGGQVFPSKKNLTTPFLIEQYPGKVIIPCISSDPYRTPVLKNRDLQESNSYMIENETLIYEKTKGFIIDSSILTNSTLLYDCLEKNSSSDGSISRNTSFEIFPRRDFMVQPTLNHIILFKNDELNLLCRYKQKIQLVGKFRGESIKSSTTVDVDFTSTFVQRKVKIGDEGKIDCVDEENKAILHSWTIETLDIYNNSHLQIEKINNSDAVACRSSEEGVKLQTVFCQGVSNCELNRDCFVQGLNCHNFREGIPCNISGSNYGSCLNFTKEDGYFSQGMIRCSTKNQSYTTKYFHGYDDILYLDWESAPLKAMIEVKVPTNITMYPHNSYPFGCRASKFISDGKIQWVIRGKDGSEILLHKNRVQDISPTYKLDYDLYTVRESNIRLIYPNDYDILCMVPMWNATGSLRNHKRINVAAKTAPVKEILIVAGVLITLLIIPLVYVIWRLKKAKEAIRNLTEQEVEEFVKGNPEVLQAKNEYEKVDAIPYNRDFEIPREKLLIDNENILGQGAFGVVLKGKVEGRSEVVAVKTVKPRCEVVQFKGFLSELKIMMYIGKHPYVVGLIGAHTDKIREKVIYIVVEYCAQGSLEDLLRNRKGSFIDQAQENSGSCVVNTYQNVSQSEDDSTVYENMDHIRTVDLLRWSYEIATGMNYLSSKKVIHADLAARNVLIHQNGTAKITDFGLSRQLFNYTQYVKKQQEPLPWRWMSIESLRNLTFSTKSDIWSYGVTLWEVFSLGDIPYPGLSWTITFVEQLTNGLRMVKPPHATNAVYDIMLNCWQENPVSRPNFQVLAECFRSMLTSMNVEIKEPTEAELLPVSTDKKTEAHPTTVGSMENSSVNGNIYINDPTPI